MGKINSMKNETTATGST